MADQSRSQSTLASAAVGRAKRRRRSATGATQAFRKQWGQRWGTFARQVSAELREGTKGEA